MNEAEAKRQAAREEAGPFVTNDPADVRWLLCGRGRPVSAGSAPYTVEVTEDPVRVWYQDIERSRVDAEERWDELGYEAAPYPWYEPLPVQPTTPAFAAAAPRPATGGGRAVSRRGNGRGGGVRPSIGIRCRPTSRSASSRCSRSRPNVTACTSR